MIATISDRQLEIIEAAGKLLTERGVSGLTIKNIAHEMDFSESAVYRHFKSKEEIIIAMLGYLTESMSLRLSKICKSKQAPKEKIIDVFQSQLDFFEANPNFVVAVFSDGLFDESKNINDAIQKIMAVNMKNLIPVITEGQKVGEFIGIMSAEDVMHIVMGSFRLQMYKWRMSNMAFDIQKEGKNTINNLMSVITQ